MTTNTEKWAHFILMLIGFMSIIGLVFTGHTLAAVSAAFGTGWSGAHVWAILNKRSWT